MLRHIKYKQVKILYAKKLVSLSQGHMDFEWHEICMYIVYLPMILDINLDVYIG